MIYEKMLYVFGFMPKFLQVVILMLLGALCLYTIFGKKSRFAKDIDFKCFAPIFIVLGLVFIRKVLYFVFAIEIANSSSFMIFICIAILVIMIWRRYGGWAIVIVILVPVLLLLVPPLRAVVVIAFKLVEVFPKFLIQDIYIFIIIFAILKRPLGLSLVRFVIYLVFGGTISLICGAYLALEVVLFARSLELCVIEHKFAGILHWLLFIIVGFFLNYLICLAAVHPLLFIGIIILGKKFIDFF